MYPHEPLRLCTMNCCVKHYENCGRCFGFGIYHGDEYREVPVAAGEAMEAKEPDPRWMVCPMCGSDWRGIPSEEESKLELEGRDEDGSSSQ